MGFSGLFLQEVIPTLACTQLLPSPPRFQNASPPLLPGCCGPGERICPGHGSLVCVGALRVTVPACHPLLDLYWPNSKKMGWLRQQAGRQETGRGVHTSLENHLAHKQPPLARSLGGTLHLGAAPAGRHAPASSWGWPGSFWSALAASILF